MARMSTKNHDRTGRSPAKPQLLGRLPRGLRSALTQCETTAHPPLSPRGDSCGPAPALTPPVQSPRSSQEPTFSSSFWADPRLR